MIKSQSSQFYLQLIRSQEVNMKISLLFCIFVISAFSLPVGNEQEGWIFKRQINLTSHLNQMESASNKSLILVGNQSLYTTDFSTPDGARNTIFTHFDEETQFTYSPTSNEVIFIDENTLNFVSLTPIQTLEVLSLKQRSLIVKKENKIFYVNSDEEQYLYRYDLSTKQLKQGPLLLGEKKLTAFLRLSKSGRIFAIIGQDLTIVDSSTLQVIQRIKLSRFYAIDLEFSSSQILFQLIYPNRIHFYQYNETSNQYKLINDFDQDIPDISVGAICHDSLICRVAEFSSQDGQTYELAVKEFNVSDFAYSVIDRLNDPSAIKMSDDGLTVIQMFLLANQYTLYQISEQGFQTLQTRQIDFGAKSLMLYTKMFKKDYLIGVQYTLDGYIWDLKKNVKACSFDPPKDHDHVTIFQDQLYFIKQNTLKIINIKDECSLKTFPLQEHQFNKIEVTNEKIYVTLLNPVAYVIYDRATVKIINKIYVNGAQDVVRIKDHIFFWIYIDHKNFIKSFDQEGKQIGKILVYCNVLGSGLLTAENELIVICNDEYNFFDATDPFALKYIGTFASPGITNNFQPTSIRNVIFSQKERTLAKFKISQWINIPIDSSKIDLYPKPGSVRFSDAYKIIFYEKNNYEAFLVKLDLHGKIKRTQTKIGENIQLQFLQIICNHKYIATTFSDIKTFKNYVNFYDANTLQLLKSVQLRKEWQFSQNGFFVDDSGMFINPLNSKVQMYSINANYTQNPKSIIKITAPIAVSQSYKYFAVGGCRKDGKKIIELWTTMPNTFVKEQIAEVESSIDSILLLENGLWVFFISSGTLYKITSNEGSIIIQNQTNHCQVLDQQRIICKLDSGETVIITQSTTQKLQMTDLQYFYSSLAVSIDKKILLQYGSDSKISIKSQQNGTFYEVQSVISPQSHITKVAIQSDNTKILTYDLTQDSAILWEYGRCSSSDKYIKDGLCVCRGDLKDLGSFCGCEAGHFVNSQENRCEMCDFLCSECEGSSGNCVSVDAVGVLMLVAGLLTVILVGLLLLKWLKNRKSKKVELTEELLESEITTQNR